MLDSNESYSMMFFQNALAFRKSETNSTQNLASQPIQGD